MLKLTTGYEPSHTLTQGSQTRGPQAACGPPDAFVRPANTSKNDKSVKFDQIWLILRAFLVNCGPQKLSSYEQRPTEHFFLSNVDLRPI